VSYHGRKILAIFNMMNSIKYDEYTISYITDSVILEIMHVCVMLLFVVNCLYMLCNNEILCYLCYLMYIFVFGMTSEQYIHSLTYYIYHDCHHVTQTHSNENLLVYGYIINLTMIYILFKVRKLFYH